MDSSFLTVVVRSDVKQRLPFSCIRCRIQTPVQVSSIDIRHANSRECSVLHEIIDAWPRRATT
ncbi:hypothetical protein AX768_22340 [Burkholderia sp. PAMC 28687]|jgi:hypothetical protein|nr:hypothetical protein AX768_22340 [Burkholderia sp. PAMC 28687]